ncbi:MAG: GNAT family protein [Planctomycetota bacterium]|nr:GNAT family protein [Planctomycetota bacterium]
MIRPAVASDAEGLVALTRAAASEPDSQLIGRPGDFSGLATSLANQRRQIARAAASSRHLVLVAEREGVLVGRLSFRAERRARVAHRGTFSIVVARLERGRGIGGGMIRALLAWCAAGGVVRKVSLRVLTSNTRARALYERLGFVIEGTMTRAVRLDAERWADELLMSIWVEAQSSRAVDVPGH